MLRVKVTGCFLLPWLLLGCSNEEQRQGMLAANIFAIQEARKIQAEIAATRKCPERLAGWQLDRYGWWLETRAGTEKVRHKLVLDCQPNLEFSVAVKYSFDSGTYVYGGPTGPLGISYGHFTDPRDIEFSLNDNAATVAARAVDLEGY